MTRARMIVERLPDLLLKTDLVAQIIEKVLQDHGDDSALFKSFAYPRANTLLDIRALSESNLAESIFKLIVDAARAAVTDWLVVVPFHRVKAPAIAVGFDGLHILERNDVAGWRSLATSPLHTSAGANRVLSSRKFSCECGATLRLSDELLPGQGRSCGRATVVLDMVSSARAFA